MRFARFGLNLHDFLLFSTDNFINFFDILIGELLHGVLTILHFVLAYEWNQRIPNSKSLDQKRDCVSAALRLRCLGRTNITAFLHFFDGV